MKKSKFKLATLGVFSIFLCSLFIVSCNKDRVSPIPVELSMWDDSTKKINIDDLDVQEFIKARDVLLSQYYSLRISAQNAIQNTIENSEEYETSDIYALFEMTKVEADTYIGIMKSSKERLTQNYSYLKFDQIDFIRFLTKMQHLFPYENSSRFGVCEEACDAVVAVATLACNWHDTPQKIAECKAKIPAIKLCCYAYCMIHGTTTPPPGAQEPPECEDCECPGPSDPPGTDPGTPTTPPNTGTCYECYNGQVVSIVHVDQALCNYNWSSGSVTLGGPCPGSGTGTGPGTGTPPTPPSIGTCYECYGGQVVSIVHVDQALCNYNWSSGSVILGGPCPGSGTSTGGGN